MDENQTLQPQDVAGIELTDKPMRFHKFLIYLTLFVGALYSLSDGLGYFTGIQYSIEGFTPEQFYAVFPSVKSIDTFFGVACLAQAGYFLYTRQRLAHLKTNGPAHLKALIIMGMLMNLVYLLMASSAMRVPVSQFLTSQLLGSVLGSLIYLLTIWIYYGKRKNVFVNL